MEATTVTNDDPRCISACREKDRLGIRQGWCWTCVQELRRQWREESAALEAQRDELRAQRDEMDQAYASLSHSAGALRVQRDELLAALREIAETYDVGGAMTGSGHEDCVYIARAALAKAGEQ